MKNLLIDLRGQSLAVLITEGKTVLYRAFIDRFSPADAQSAAALDRISRESGVKPDKAHLILPAELVSVATHRIPFMSEADAGKVIRRKIAKDTGTTDPVFGILPLTAGGEKQAWLVETVDRESCSPLIEFLRSRGIAVKTLATALRANLKALGQVSVDPARRAALIDLGRSHIEFTVLSGDQLRFFERIAIPPLDAEKESDAGTAPERIEKMRVYRTVESVYTAYMSYQNDFPDAPVTSVWISGAGHSLTGISDVLKESTGVAVTRLNLLGDEEDGPVYTALYGLALGLADGTAVNYLPKDLAHAFPRGRTMRIAAACAFVALFAAAVAVESKYLRTKSLFDARQQEVLVREQDVRESAVYSRNREYLTGLLRREADLYPLFGYLADNTPAGVYIGGLSFGHKGGGPSIEIEFIAPSVSEVGTRKLLSRIIAMIDRSGLLRRQGEPAISITKRKNAVLLHFKVACEVLSHEKAR